MEAEYKSLVQKALLMFLYCHFIFVVSSIPVDIHQRVFDPHQSSSLEGVEVEFKSLVQKATMKSVKSFKSTQLCTYAALLEVAHRRI